MLGTTNLVAPKKGEEEFDDVISDAAQYGRVQFWDLRYASEHEPFEWYYDYTFFMEPIKEHIPLDTKTMIAGCGSSNMIGDMADDGYTNLVAADISRVVITQLKYRYKDYPEISFFQGTMCDTDLPEGSIGAVVDKALLDSLLCTGTGAITAAQYINEVRRCLLTAPFWHVFQVERLLKDDGVFICISYGSPEQRLQYLEQYDIDEPYYLPWMVEVQAVCKWPEIFYFVVCGVLVIPVRILLNPMAQSGLKPRLWALCHLLWSNLWIECQRRYTEDMLHLILLYC